MTLIETLIAEHPEVIEDMKAIKQQFGSFEIIQREVELNGVNWSESARSNHEHSHSGNEAPTA